MKDHYRGNPAQRGQVPRTSQQNKPEFYKEYYLYGIEALTIPGSAGTNFLDVDQKLDLDADWEMHKRTHEATNHQIRLRYKDDATGRNYSNQASDIRTISGAPVSDITFAGIVQQTGLRPYILPGPVLFRAATNITHGFADYSGAANAVYLALHGAKIRPGRAPWFFNWKYRLAFDYTFRQTIAANQTLSASIPINIDSHFLIKKITGISTGPYMIVLKDGATDRQWMDKPLHSRTFIGNAHNPNILSSGRLALRGSVIWISIQNLTAQPNAVEITFTGEKLFE